MQLLNRTPTRHYFVSIFIIVSVLFVTYSAVIYNHYSKAQQLNDWTLYNYEVLRQSRRILFYLVDMETGVRGYMITRNKEYLAPYDNAQLALADQVNELRSFSKQDEAIHEKISLWLEKIQEFTLLLNHQLDMVRSRNAATLSAQALKEQKMRMDNLRELLEGEIQPRLKSLQAKIAASRETQNNFKYILAIGTLLAVGGMFVVTLVILALMSRSEKAEEEARRVENRFLTVMNGIDDGLYDFNLLDESLYFSPSYKSMLGYTDEEHPNTLAMVNSILHPEDFDQVWETVRQYQAGEIPTYHSVFRLRHKDGHWLWVLSRGVGLRDPNGKMVRIIGTHTDITEQKKREEELKQLTKEMENFTYITSHDLRAPLVNLKGFAAEIQHAIDKIKPISLGAAASHKEVDRAILQQAFDQDIPESLRFIVQSVEKMDALTTAILDLSRIGTRKHRFEPVDTQALMERCLDTLGYEIKHNHIEVSCGYLPTITSDALALEQIFTNILDNAVKYLEPSRAGKISISAKEVENQMVFSFKDNGRGIADADRAKVFQIFRRARNTLNIRGQGMGMTFVQATLRRLGGTIWFDSTQGVGTTFYIGLPKNIKTREKSL